MFKGKSQRKPNSGSFRKGENHPRWIGGVRSNKELRQKIKIKQKEYLRNLRKSTLEALGGKCIKCNFSDERALQIDHINGGGSKERKEKTFKGYFEKHVLESFLSGENKYQLLCANCNWIKRFVNNEKKT